MKYGPLLALATVVVAAGVWADTIHLTNGVEFDGVVTPMSDGKTYKVQAADRVLMFRPEEIATIEKNNRTGYLNIEEEKAKYDAENKRLTELTGLNEEQRNRIEALLGKLKSEEPAQLAAVRDQLRTLQQEMDVFKYLEYFQPQFSHLLCVNVLETLYYLDPERSRSALRENAFAPYYWARAKALELLGRLRDTGSADLIERGLKDHIPEVQYTAAYVCAAIGAKETTPALIERLASADPRVANAAKEALAALWSQEIGQNPAPATPEEWTAFWNERAASVKAVPVTLAALEPLIQPEQEYQNE